MAHVRRPRGNLTIGGLEPERGDIAFLIRHGETSQSVRLHVGADGLAADLFPSPNQEAKALATLDAVHEACSWPHDRDTQFTIKFREHRWLVYANHCLVGALAAPFQAPASVHVPEPRLSGAVPETRFQPVAEVSFQSDFMIPEGAPNQLHPWRPENGNWRIHTALDEALSRPESNIERIERVPLTPDRSPNFYCLKGFGKDALLTTGYDFYDDYRYAAAVQVNDGEAGLVFYYRDAQNYYAFTMVLRPPPDEGGFLRLWRVSDGERTELARVDTDLFVNQWYRPEVRVRNERIRCYLDGIQVVSIGEPMPVGGRIGLYSDGADEVRFDDVDLRTIDELNLEDVEHIRFHTLHHEGTFYRDESFFRRATPPDQQELRPRRAGQGQVLVLGRAWNRNVVFSAEFAPRSSPFGIGLVMGFTDPNSPHYRFTVSRDRHAEWYRLERIDTGRAHVVEEWSRSLASERNTGPSPIHLLADASRPGVLRLYKDGEMVLLQHLPAPLVGGVGPFLAPRTQAIVRDLDFRYERQDLCIEQPQPNEMFEQDSFMRHWSSPEGQWLPDDNNDMWHIGDFFGDFTIELPRVAGSELHLGVREGRTRGDLVLAVEKDRFLLRDAQGTTMVEAASPSSETRPGPGQRPCYELHREGAWVWVESSGQPVLRHRPEAPLTGTRLRTSGLTYDDLSHSKVTRHGVIDDFFDEAPYRWIINGGDWKVINRFQCTPSWSHMDGESADGMAALWHKRLFEGDLTLEFYAGMRHGWYSRAGDLNCSIMASTSSPDAGYTVTCTEWDEDHSQNWSTLYRRGDILDRSDAYLVPRSRAGNERRYYNPLIVQGRRPIHGAWYYVKFRRVGRKLEYHFDNELIFSFEDGDPLPEGLLGIWTFMNSMTVARVKITYERSRPRPFDFTTVFPGRARRRSPQAGSAAPVHLASTAGVPDILWKMLEGRVVRSAIERGPGPSAMQELESADAGITIDGFPLDCLAPRHWSVDDNVGHAHMTPFARNGLAGLRLVNRLGSGNMFLAPDLPALPLARVAGWQFEVKRTRRARLNLHYSTGRTVAQGRYRVGTNCFHHLNGTEFSAGEFVLTGRTDVPASGSLDDNDGRWHRVTAWIPSSQRSAEDARRNVLTRFEGFGHRQPSRIVCGIGGAFPGDGYAVRGLTPIFYGAPEIRVPDAGRARTFRVTVPGQRVQAPLLETTSHEELNEFLNRLREPGIHRVRLHIESKGRASRLHDMAWVCLPERVDYHFDWHPERPDTVLLRASSAFPDPRFASAKVLLAGKPLELLGDHHEERIALLPRHPDNTLERNRRLEFTLQLDGQSTIHHLALDATPTSGPPVLVGLEGGSTFCETFENTAAAKRRLHGAPGQRLELVYGGPSVGQCLRIRNRQYGDRLAAVFSADFSIAQHPLLLFRYRGFDMSRISVALDRSTYVRLSDETDQARAVRFGQDLTLDGRWRTWLGLVSDAFHQDSFTVERFAVDTLGFGSVGRPDQTGRFSRLYLDDLVSGPAVARAEQLAATPRYFHINGIVEVRATVSAGPQCFDELGAAAIAALEWKAFEPGQRIVPEITELPDGVHHLLLKAFEPEGMVSSVTDIPFLIDRKPLEASYEFGSTDDPVTNGVQVTIRLDNVGEGAPWAAEQATFQIAGKPSKIPAWTNRFIHTPQAAILHLNYPLILRTHLDRAQDGDTIEFAVDDIVDGAGNPSPRLTIPVRVDHAGDKTGPAWYYMQCGKSVHWFCNWDGSRSRNLVFTPGRRNEAAIVHTAGDSPYLQTMTFRQSGDISRTVTWKPAVHPWLSFRMRLPDLGNDSVVRVALTTADDRTYTLSLRHPGKGRNELNRTRTIAWQPRQWQRLSFNVKHWLEQAGVPTEEIADMTIATLHFQRRNAGNRERLLIDDLFLHGGSRIAAEKDDTLTWIAYDASGVAGLEIDCVAENDQVLWQEFSSERTVDLGPLRKRASGLSWLRCRARDKAGNLSVPFWYPLPEG